MRALITALTIGLVAAPALADEAALLIGNDRYEAFDRVRAARAIDDAGGALSRAGAEVVAVEDTDRAAALDAIRQFSQRREDAEAMAVVLVGHFGRIGEQTWFLPTDTEGEGIVEVAASGIPLSLLAEMLGEAPGAAILVLGTEDEIDTSAVTLPQGVTLAVAAPEAALRFVEDRLAKPGAGVTGANGVTLDGFVSSRFSFIQSGQRTTTGGAPRPAPTPTPAPQPQADAEAQYWRLTQERDNAAAYASYLDRYPGGRFSSEAQARLDRLNETPEQRAARTEDDLGLSREQRQGVQRNLSVLGFDTRGIDGIFGSGTRGAIRGWQQGQGYEVTGYLTAQQLTALETQGSRRAAELEAEERERRERMRREDEALWAEMGQDRSEQELANYIDRFPDGLHAEEARRQLNQIRDRRAADEGASQRERQIWRATQQENTRQGYQAYINAFPDGQFVNEARAAIDQLQQQGQQNNEAAAAEGQLGLTPLTRRAVEQRLAALGFQPGQVDGSFDDQTRAALRRYQQSAGLPQTGYVNQITAVRLLADTLSDILR